MRVMQTPFPHLPDPQRLHVFKPRDGRGEGGAGGLTRDLPLSRAAPGFARTRGCAVHHGTRTRASGLPCSMPATPPNPAVTTKSAPDAAAVPGRVEAMLAESHRMGPRRSESFK